MLSVGYVDHPLDDRFVRGTEMVPWTLEYLSAGHIRVQTPHGRQRYHAPLALLIPPHTPYIVEWAGGPGEWKELYAIFDPPPHWSALLSWPTTEDQMGVLDLQDSVASAEVEAALQEALTAQRSARINRQFFAFNALEKALLILDEINPQRGHASREARIEQSLEFIAAHYHQPLDIEILAREAFLSPSRYSHLFKHQIGQSPMQYVEQYRLERAAERLLTIHNSIEQISDMVGFNNAFHFSTRFRRFFGQSPSRYRRSPQRGNATHWPERSSTSARVKNPCPEASRA